MTIKTEFGEFELIKNYREAFNLEQFILRYVDVAFDRYTYLVGDVSSTILRIKGFSKDDQGANSYKLIPDYLNESCSKNCAYYILKRIKKEAIRKDQIK